MVHLLVPASDAPHTTQVLCGASSGATYLRVPPIMSLSCGHTIDGGYPLVMTGGG